MAIHGSDTNTAISSAFSEAKKAVTATPAPTATQQSTAGSTSGKFSWSALGQFSGHTMTRSPIGESLLKTVAALGEVLKDQNSTNYEVKLIPLDVKDYARLPISVIVLTLRDKSVSTPVVSAHILLLENSVEPWTPITRNVGGVNIEIQRPTSVAYDANIGNIVADEVARQYPGNKILAADAAVIPSDFDITDKTRVYQLAANALLAAESRIFEFQGRPQLNVVNADSDSSLTVRTQFLSGQAQQLDAVGLPLRSDIEVSITAVYNNQQQQQQFGQQLLERQRDLGYATGFIDTVWDPVVQQNSFGGFQQMNQFTQIAADGSQPTAKYRGLFVITDSRIQELSSTTAQVFSLFPSLLLRENNAWHGAFRPRSSGDDALSSKNAGALNLEANLPLPASGNQPDPSGRGPILDLRSANFSDQEFGYYMQAIFRPGLGIAIDVPECGASTWYSSIFADVASGNQAAYDELYNATDILTNGLFSKKFNRGETIATHYSVVHNGWYVDNNGRHRDIRDFDFVALCNNPMAEDKMVVDAWINSFSNTSQSMDVRLHDRFRIISKAYAEVHLTGFSNRIILSDNFLSKALEAAHQAGLNLRPQNQFVDTGIVSRVSANLNAGLFGMGGAGSVFNSGINMNTNTNTGFNNYTSRNWGRGTI